MITLNDITFIDVETTGLSIADDRIVQISIRKGKENFTTLINPGIPVSQEAFEIHGLTDELLKTAPKFEDIVETLIPFIDDETCKYLCGYNVAFDFKFLQAEMVKCNLYIESKDYNFLDPFLIHKTLNPRDLASLYKAYTGKELENAHNSEHDMIACQEILLAQQQMTSKNIDELSALTGLKQFTIGGWLELTETGYTITRGKHMGAGLSSVANSDPNYILWLMSLPDLSIEEHFILKEYI